MAKMVKLDKVVRLEELDTPDGGFGYEVQFDYPSSEDGEPLTRKGVVIAKYGTPSIKLYNTGGSSRPYSTYNLEKVVGPLKLVALHKGWTDPNQEG